MSNFVDYGNMTALMTGIKSAIDNAGGGGGTIDGYVEVPGATFADAKIGDIIRLSQGTAFYIPSQKITFKSGSAPTMQSAGNTTCNINEVYLMLNNELSSYKFFNPLSPQPSSLLDRAMVSYNATTGKVTLSVRGNIEWVTHNAASSSWDYMLTETATLDITNTYSNFKLYRVKS